jgi:hypothetical protein
VSYAKEWKKVSDGDALGDDERDSLRDVFADDINISLVVETKKLAYTKEIKDIYAARICIRLPPKVRFRWLSLM